MRAAARYRIDARAALAVARGEGGLVNRQGDIGDLGGGGSYGPFQLYAQGALPKRFRGNPTAADRWAWSQQGINYAIRQMAKAGAAGLTGPQAVETIIRRFEKPADPDSSVRNALERYQGSPALKATPQTPGPLATAAAAVPAVDMRRQMALAGLQQTAAGQFDPLRLLSQYAALQQQPPPQLVRRATKAAKQATAPGKLLGGKYRWAAAPRRTAAEPWATGSPTTPGT
jgi:hypothetical protein